MIRALILAIAMGPTETYAKESALVCDPDKATKAKCAFVVYDGGPNQSFLHCNTHSVTLRCVEPQVGTTHEQLLQTKLERDDEITT